MIKRSWFYENGLFFTILAIVILFHIALLAMRMYQSRGVVNIPQSVTDPPVKVRIISSPLAAINKQIVQSEDPTSSQKPTERSYLSDKDRKFDRQTVARTIGEFTKSSKGESRKKETPPRKASGEFKKGISLSDLGAFPRDHHPLREAAVAASHKKMGTQEGQEIGRGVSSTNDYIQGIPLGDITYLNTVEYKYYGFFHRIRQKLEGFWNRSIQEKAGLIMKGGRQIASREELITSLEVTLNEIGEIISVSVRNSSGVRELDEAAVESFNEAGPFPHPPKGLIEDGLVKIQWGFVVNT